MVWYVGGVCVGGGGEGSVVKENYHTVGINFSQRCSLVPFRFCKITFQGFGKTLDCDDDDDDDDNDDDDGG